MRYTHVFFDLDGTLNDSQFGIINATRYALRQHGFSDDVGDPTRFLGPPLIDSMQNCFGLDFETATKAVKSFREYYGDKGLYENILYEGIKELLAALYSAGIQCVLATSKGEPFALRILEHFDIRQYFIFVAAADINGGRDTKAEVLHHALGNIKPFPLKNAIMVGDRNYDVDGAHEVGLSCAAVLYGYGSREELEDAGAEFIIHTVKDLKKFLLG